MHFIKKTQLIQFIPKEFDYLTKTKKIKYNGLNLKTDYLINIMHDMILKYILTDEIKQNLSSTILRKKFTKTYKHYIDYLLDKKFMFFISNYFNGKKSKTYKLNITISNITRCTIDDKILLKKYNEFYLSNCNIDNGICPKIKNKLIDDLKFIKIDHKNSLKWLNDNKKKMIETKYFKNLISIDNINSNNIFFKFDQFGRFHTNYTILKKEIRQKYITINNNKILEIDISNSQPLFFAVFLKDEIGYENFNEEMKKYVDLVKNGLLYEYFMKKYDKVFKDRDCVKKMMYKILFGDNGKDDKHVLKYFKSGFPSIYDYIIDYKKRNKSYKYLSHKLQKYESNFIFNNVINDIYNKIPKIKLFTVHDSINVEAQYYNDVKFIFDYYLKKLI